MADFGSDQLAYCIMLIGDLKIRFYAPAILRDCYIISMFLGRSWDGLINYSNKYCCCYVPSNCKALERAVENARPLAHQLN